jgi:hypothetical protein
MEHRDLAEMVLLQLECFWTLQEIDERLRRGDNTAIALMKAVYSRRPMDWHEIQPLLRLKTTLSQIVIPVSFAKTLPPEKLNALSIKPEHRLIFRENGNKKTPTTVEVICVLRNALAHLFDFAAGDVAPNISFDKGIVRFSTEPPNQSKKTHKKRSEVVFETEDGFVKFLGDLFPLVRRATREFLDGISQQETTVPNSSPGEQTVATRNLQQLQAEGWRLIQEFSPFDQAEVADFPREVAALKLWAKAKLHEVEGISPERQEWQAALEMAIEAAYRVGCTDGTT